MPTSTDSQAHLEDDEVEQDEDEVQGNATHGLQLANNCLGIFELKCQVLTLLHAASKHCGALTGC